MALPQVGRETYNGSDCSWHAPGIWMRWREKMDVYECIRSRRTVREFKPAPVPDEIVHKILQAARWAPSSSNSQPWHFIVVENRDTLRQLGALVRTGSYVAQAPLVVVVAIEKTQFAVSDASRAIQSMILTAWSAGIGSNWVGFLGMIEVKSLLGIPDALEVLAILPFGYPAQAIGQGKKQRKSLSEVAHRERFGQPFE